MQAKKIRPDRLPKHVAIIMDGNGRWAQQQGRSRIEGHRQGVESVRAVIRAAHELGIPTLTLYAFSQENWNRPKREVTELMRLLERYLKSELEEIAEQGIRLRVMGRTERLPETVRRNLASAIERTEVNQAMELVFALSYGGRQEIVDAAQKLAHEAQDGRLEPDSIDEKMFQSKLYLPDLPDPDLLIRTGGESRVSNFLLWQIAYAELHTTDVMWPEFRRAHLVDAILDYQSRERRFGMTGDQIRGKVR